MMDQNSRRIAKVFRAHMDNLTHNFKDRLLSKSRSKQLESEARLSQGVQRSFRNSHNTIVNYMQDTMKEKAKECLLDYI